MERITYRPGMTTRDYYRLYPEYYRASAQSRRQRNLAYVNAIKAQGCSKCGYKTSTRALSFHHTGDDKEATVGRLVNGMSSIDKIQTEIDKCVLLCANCHAELHDDIQARASGKATVS